MFVYDSETLQQINASVDLFEYASQSMEMKQKGRDYFSCCPLHEDKTPSLSFTPSKNCFYCFSCGVGGYIIDFLQEFENLSFADSVEKASKLANIDLSKMCKSETVMFLKKAKSTHVNKIVKFNHQILNENEFKKYQQSKIEEWLDEGISQEVLDMFDIRIDNIANRIVYAVRDIDGKLINIKGRTRRKNFKMLGIPKYINYYPVGVVDYFQSLNISLPYIKEKKEIIIFESLKSTLKCWDWGYKNTVSAEKHTFTPEQIFLLAKLHVNITICFDSDVDYSEESLKDAINKLKRITNVYIIYDKDNLLGGKKAKNSPVDLGQEIWEKLYNNKTKII